MTREAPGTQGSAADPSDPRCFCAGPCRVGPLGPGPKLRNMPTRYRTPEALSRNLTIRARARMCMYAGPLHVKHDIHRSGPRTTISSLHFLPLFFKDQLPSPTREVLGASRVVVERAKKKRKKGGRTAEVRWEIESTSFIHKHHRSNHFPIAVVRRQVHAWWERKTGEKVGRMIHDRRSASRIRRIYLRERCFTRSRRRRQ